MTREEGRGEGGGRTGDSGEVRWKEERVATWRNYPGVEPGRRNNIPRNERRRRKRGSYG